MTKEAKAYNAAGYRERFAMKNGTKKVEKWGNRTVWRYFYSPTIEYQDANGATYDPEREVWVG